MLPGFIHQKNNSGSKISFIFNEEFWLDKNRNVRIFSCDFALENYKPSYFNQLGIVFPSDLQKAVPRRQAEFLAGRFAAKKAMQNSNPNDMASQTVHIGPQRCPIWPQTFIGSITHNNSKAICAVTDFHRKTQLGIDFESYMPNLVAIEIERNIHSNNEKKILVEQGMSSNIATTIIFSSKESLFKSLYPKVRKYFGFNQAAVSAFNSKDGSLILTIARDFANEHSIPRQYLCNVALTDEGVFTFIYNRTA